MENQPFDHAERTTAYLQDHLQELIHHGNTVPLGPERVKQLGHEVACLVFELEYRERNV